MKHKFMNKKIGAEAKVMAMYLDSDGVMQVDGYDTVEDLMDDYGAYEPAEPLIKDEKVRKAVRAWAEVNKIGENDYVDERLYFDAAEHRLRWINTSIEFDERECLEGLKDGKKYTIAELCGEEEE